MPTSGIVAGAGFNKDEVNYRQHEKCKSCDHYYFPNSCDIVDGNISPEGVCNKWEIKPKEEVKGPEFFKAEYEKSKT